MLFHFLSTHHASVCSHLNVLSLPRLDICLRGREGTSVRGWDVLLSMMLSATSSPASSLLALNLQGRLWRNPEKNPFRIWPIWNSSAGPIKSIYWGWPWLKAIMTFFICIFQHISYVSQPPAIYKVSRPRKSYLGLWRTCWIRPIPISHHWGSLGISIDPLINTIWFSLSTNPPNSAITEPTTLPLGQKVMKGSTSQKSMFSHLPGGGIFKIKIRLICHV